MREGRVSLKDRETGRQTDSQTEVKVTPVRQMEEHKKPHKEIYAPFKRGTLTHPR